MIYELSARAVGGLAGVRERLPYLRELGTTALWRFGISGDLPIVLVSAAGAESPREAGK